MARRAKRRVRRAVTKRAPRAAARRKPTSNVEAIRGHLRAAGNEILLAAQGSLCACSAPSGRRGGAAAVPDLTILLRRANAQMMTVRRAARALARSAAGTLAEGLRSENPYVSWASSFGLAELGRGAVPALARALRDHSARVRRDAIVTLGKLGPAAKGAVNDIARALRDHAPHVRKAAAWALADIGPAARKSIPALAAALRVKDREVRDAAASALCRISRTLVVPSPRRPR